MARVPRLTCLLIASLLAACSAAPGGGGSGSTGSATAPAPAAAHAPATTTPAAPAPAPGPAQADSVLGPSRDRAPLVKPDLPPGLPPLIPLEGAPPEADYAKPDAKPETCREPRRDKCSLDYKPVCAEVDTGVRCIRAPCPSSERKTFGSACRACRDPGVTTYVEGRCPPT